MCVFCALPPHCVPWRSCGVGRTLPPFLLSYCVSHVFLGETAFLRWDVDRGRSRIGDSGRSIDATYASSPLLLIVISHAMWAALAKAALLDQQDEMSPERHRGIRLLCGSYSDETERSNRSQKPLTAFCLGATGDAADGAPDPVPAYETLGIGVTWYFSASAARSQSA